ncbi:ATP-dependent DNA helicase UvrD2 [Mycobacteroides franklinii]|uniref:ATP-dependent DNA helicase UvrD2 n=2 Tax=Actinomycetes TaxID=1760 RepID=A0A4R8R2C8_9MYCO|nr:ATP-dependent DNA helicase UvrD2 [Mycobacteroides franklinii]TDZ43161.1 ATP-dependent DNA helicase UvrD2 [Mycobacteroides franklinii]TDZ50296.1 ATP-dependent DNA helicase UvrD2 [Mycobacteroides franklinii]TDZ56716.1 ATP-dependent DNA helicase UvrD2 [Mycobacteroides franklinii]TDZ63657.1 ATP-dependent DNA helicase UvrD2 [Mycobacteroides franklinii]TDZ70054.1 ATP-dependent DNA helicase UvrD2 [Mycobacteroides franklinii]
MARSLLDGLDDEQRAAVTAPRGPVCVLAGAGTGKTRTITHRIAHLVESGHVAAGQILAVTFTQRAAGEMRGRLRDLGVGSAQAVTFHAAGLRQLRYFWPRLVGDTRWELIDSKFTLVAQAANRAKLSTTTDTVRDLAGEIEWAKASLISPEAYPAAAAKFGRDAPVPAEQVAKVYAGYEKLKARPDGSTLLDFDDLLLHTAAAIENSEAVADEFRDRYRCFVVDEYQDVTPLQQRVLDAWLGPRDDLTVVGDANQTIYSFTGATPQYLLGFSRRFPDATVVRLERDYRSTPQVVSLANRLISAAQGRVAGSKLQLVGQRPAGPAPRFSEHDDEAAEARSAAKSIAGLIESGTPASEIAVLYRINAQSEVYEEALTEAGIPFQVRGGEGFFTRQEVRQSLVALQRAADRESAELPVPQQVREVLEPLGLSAEEPHGTQARERWESLRALVELAEEECARQPELDLPGLVRELRVRAEARHPPTVQGVTLASLHAAKGLEWDAVFLVGLADGTLPISHALSRSGDIEPVEEERRLLYVGITRARVHVSLSWALARAAGGRKSRKHSRFLNGIAPSAQLPAAATPRRRGNGARCRICNASLSTPAAVLLRRCESCPSDIDEELLAALKDWRLQTAKEMKVPAFVVFTDNTLIAIAELLPGDDAALVAIPGIGARKLEQYGPDVLRLVRARSS